MLILPDEVRRSRLISDDYRACQERMHKNPDYGMASQYYAPIVSQLCNQYGTEELLDYGAGKGRLAKSLQVNHAMRVQHYDPAIPAWADDPEPAEMVACIDVLEHIEPDLIDNVLDDLQRVTQRIAVFTVGTVPALKELDDGRNAHLIVKPSSWWLPKLMERFELHIFQKQQDGFLVVMMPNEVVNQ